MKLFFSSCIGSASESGYCAELIRLAKLDPSETTTLVSTPEEADIILIVDIFEAGYFAGLCHNPVWKKWPEKSFAYQEGNDPLPILHGIYTSPHKAWIRSGRFQAGGYPMHQKDYRNPCPPPVEMAAGPKDLLFSFAGRCCHPVRQRLFGLTFPATDVMIEDTSAYRHFDFETENREVARRHYWELVRRSKYVLCPRGSGSSSIRLFEMMETGTAPVIISDDWLPPLGPKWEEFALFVPEREIASLYEKIKSHESEFVKRGQLARNAWEEYFSPECYWKFMLTSIREIQKCQKYPESLYVRALPLLLAQAWLRPRWKAAVRRLQRFFSRVDNPEG
jgi:hypothetical protein